ncbi:MAG: GNAT family N-acetyltransferase [Patescibacteria group bacterium]|nr:GNAT family N-acetyltransferase [Patescibacteria group bacterium]
MLGETYRSEGQPSSEQKRNVLMRPFEQTDLPHATSLAQNNIRKSFAALFPKEVMKAYLAANNQDELKHAVNDEGTETNVLMSPEGKLLGFALIRFNPRPRRNAYGELDLRRLHIDETAQGQGLGRRLFEWMHERAKSPEINSEYVTSHASGSSRLFFEREGWEGKTMLNDMSKKGTSAIVFVAHKLVRQKEVNLFNPPTHIVYAGGNSAKSEYLSELIRDLNISLPIIRVPARENEQTQDVVEAATSKALSASGIIARGKVNPLVIANDIRADLMTTRIDNEGKLVYSLMNKGKPKTHDELLENFRILAYTARITEKPAPYIIRTATVLHSLTEPDNDSYSERDVSVWLSQDILEKLSTESGIVEYISAVSEKFGADVLSMSGGLCLPYFLEIGAVGGMNGHDFRTLPKRELVIKDALQIAISGIDKKIVRERFGLIQV